jgi:hypothetical protein
MPPRIKNVRKELRTRCVATWPYGHFQTAYAEYFLIAGLVQFHGDETSRATSLGPEEDGGLLVELRGSRCPLGVANCLLRKALPRAQHCLQSHSQWRTESFGMPAENSLSPLAENNDSWNRFKG